MINNKPSDGQTRSAQAILFFADDSLVAFIMSGRKKNYRLFPVVFVFLYSIRNLFQEDNENELYLSSLGMGR